MTRREPDPALSRRLRLIVITDAGVAAPRTVAAVVEAALRGGAPAVQLRGKSAPAWELLVQAEALRALTRRHGALFIVNDRVDVALASNADGVHLGPDDLPVAAVRSAVPSGFLIGYSTDEVGMAHRAVRDGADYLGCGAVYSTSNKSDAGSVIGPCGLESVARAVPVPVVGIGGVTEERAGELANTGAAGVAVIGAVMGAPDPAEAAARLLVRFNG